MKIEICITGKNYTDTDKATITLTRDGQFIVMDYDSSGPLNLNARESQQITDALELLSKEKGLVQ